MEVKVFSVESQHVMPWKNGLGTTRELCSDAAKPGGEWTWRLSLADVPQAGPFSEFPGVDRHILCVRGGGMHVSVDGSWQRVPRVGDALRFRGEAQVKGQPHGHGVQDMNLMVHRAFWRGAMRMVRGGHLDVQGASFLILHATHTAGTCKVGDHAVNLQLGQTALVKAPGVPAIHPDGKCAWVLAALFPAAQ